MSYRLLVIGATSSIATAVARRYATRGARLMLVARRAEALAAIATDLRVRGAAEVATMELEANDIEQHTAVLDEAWRLWGGFDAALVAYGTLPDQATSVASVAATLACFDTNARSVIALATQLVNRFDTQGVGVLALISSPAGDRGRASNYVYGCAKAAVTNFASGARHRFARSKIRVLTILPGFVDTPMTASFPKGPLWAHPDRVAADIERALDGGFGVLYTPWFWRWIMLVIKLLPERIFVRMNL